MSTPINNEQDKIPHQGYGLMIALSEDMKQNVKEMSDEQMDMLSNMIAYSMNKTKGEIMKKLDKEYENYDNAYKH